MRYIFHLSIPVTNLDSVKVFYEAILGGSVGREEHDWVDILLWGHQITLQHRPEEVLDPNDQGTRHFGVILPWKEWEILSEKIQSSGVKFLKPPHVKYPSTKNEQAKFYLQDPSYNVIEIKAYRNQSSTVGAGNEEYNYLDT